MLNRLYTFLNIIYLFQLGFEQKHCHCTSFALTHLTETIKEALDLSGKIW